MIVGRYDLPASMDLICLDSLPMDARCHFVGDADPTDVLSFAWLREHVPTGWLGVNNNLLNDGRVLNGASLEIAMSDAEKQSMNVLRDLCPDFRNRLGPYCSGSLDRGFEIELEATLTDRRDRSAI
jgi:hypothetical protein